MRIGVYKDSLSTGRGADRAVKNFAAGISARGHEVILFEKPGLAERLTEMWDVLIATGSNEIVDLMEMGYFKRPNRARVILQLHLAPRGFFKWRHPFRNYKIRRAFNLADDVQVLCSSYVEEFRRIAAHPRVTVIGNYTEYLPKRIEAQSSSTDKAAMPKSPKAHTILYPAAALNRIKNQKLLIRAFAHLANDFPEWNVRLLGKDTTPYARACKRLVQKLGLEKRIVFVGFTNNLDGEYNRARFIAFPSRLEGFPLALLEAAQMGLPAVALTTLPGISDIVTAETGVTSANDAASYAKALATFMRNPSLAEQKGKAAQMRCQMLYSRSTILDQWEELLKVKM